MGVIFDTGILIECERRGTDPGRLLTDGNGGPFGISVVSIAELLHGAHRADVERRKRERLAFVEKVCELFHVFDYDMAVAKIFAEVWSNTAQKGISIGVNDLIIASTALSRGYSVVTLNKKDFEKIEGLRVEPPHNDR